MSGFIQIGIVRKYLQKSLKILTQTLILVGILYTYCVGPYVNYLLFQWLCLSIPVIFIAIFSFFPDTPYFYVSKGKREKAIEALMFLRQADEDEVLEELEEIEASLARSSEKTAHLRDIFIGPNLKGTKILSDLPS